MSSRGPPRGTVWPPSHPSSVTFTVAARWDSANGDHGGTLAWNHAAKAGDQGNRVTARRSPGVRASKACRSVSRYGSGDGVFRRAVRLTRVLLDRRRNASWEHEIGHLGDDGGGRTNRQS